MKSVFEALFRSRVAVYRPSEPRRHSPCRLRCGIGGSGTCRYVCAEETRGGHTKILAGFSTRMGRSRFEVGVELGLDHSIIFVHLRSSALWRFHWLTKKSAHHLLYLLPKSSYGEHKNAQNDTKTKRMVFLPERRRCDFLLATVTTPQWSVLCRMEATFVENKRNW
jgi:hypothetical protein